MTPSHPDERKRIVDSDGNGFVFDKWLYVRADSAELARRFFGAPPDWPVEFDRFEPHEKHSHLPRRVWRVLSEGLIIK